MDLISGGGVSLSPVLVPPQAVDLALKVSSAGEYESMPLWLLVASSAALSAVLASFFTLAGERTARGETLGGRSHCACGRQLEGYENLPVLGFLTAGGSARCCGSKLPISYLVGELSAAVAAGLAAWYGSYGAAAVTILISQAAVFTYAYSRGKRSS